MKKNMKTGKTKNRPWSEKDDIWMGEMVREAMRQRPSVPPSSKCPDPANIRKLAFKEKIDPPTAKAVLLHLSECFDCSQIAQGYVNEYRAQKND